MRASLRGAISTGGARLRYCVEGSGRPALVIGSSIYYPRTFSARLRESLRLAFVDVRHFAEPDAAPGLDDISLDSYMADLELLRDQLRLERFVVIGHSHHGNLALEYAKRYPARVSHVVLIGSPPLDVGSIVQAAERYWEEHASAERKAVLEQRLGVLGKVDLERMSPAQAYVTRYLADAPRYWFDPAYDGAHLWRDMPINMDAVRGFRSFFADGYVMDWDPESLAAPVLVVMGRCDYAVPPVLWDEVRPALRNLTLRVFEQSGHTPQLEEPERFDRVLLEWLDCAASTH